MEGAVENVVTNRASLKSKAAWVVITSAALFFFYQFMLITIFNALNKHVLAEFHLNATALGHLSSLYFLSSIISLIPAGIVLDRCSTRKAILTAMSVSILCTLAFAISVSVHMAMMARFVAGFSGAFCFLSSIRLATRWYSRQQLALVIGLVVSLGMVGGIVAQVPMTALSDLVGWRWAMVLMAGAGILMLIPIYKYVSDYPADYKAEDDCHAFKPSIRDFLSILGAALKNRQNWLGGLYISLLNLPIFLLGAMWGSLYLSQVHHLGRTQAAIVTSMIFVGMIFGSPTMGWLSDYWGSRKRPMILLALIATLPMLLLISGVQLSILKLLLLFFAIGFLISAQVIGYPLVAESNSPIITGTAEGIASTLMIAGGLSQHLFGWLMDRHWQHMIVDNVPLYTANDYRYALWILPIAGAVSAAVALSTRESYPKKTCEDKNEKI